MRPGGEEAGSKGVAANRSSRGARGAPRRGIKAFQLFDRTIELYAPGRISGRRARKKGEARERIMRTRVTASPGEEAPSARGPRGDRAGGGEKMGE